MFGHGACVRLDRGVEIEKYTVVRMVASGGMGAVYVVRHSVLGTHHALKVLTSYGPGSHERLVREGRMQAQLDHANVVPTRDVLLIDGRPALLMDLVRGPSLAELMQHRTFTLPEVLWMFRGIVAGVAAAHRRDIVHRDLKPANVLCDPTEDGVIPRVADFGIAKAAGGDLLGDHTGTGMFLGTPRYAAPEQLDDSTSVDARADVWSLGCILYELLIGRPPFQAHSLGRLLMDVRDGVFDDPARVRADLPEVWVALLRDMIRPDPSERPVDACAVLERLESMGPGVSPDIAREATLSTMPLSGPDTPSPMEALASGSRPTVSVDATSGPAERGLSTESTLTAGPASASTAADVVDEPGKGRGRLLWAGIAIGLVAVGGIAVVVGLSPPAGWSDGSRLHRLRPGMSLQLNALGEGVDALSEPGLRVVQTGEVRRFEAVNGLGRPMAWPTTFSDALDGPALSATALDGTPCEDPPMRTIGCRARVGPWLHEPGQIFARVRRPAGGGAVYETHLDRYDQPSHQLRIGLVEPGLGRVVTHHGPSGTPRADRAGRIFERQHLDEQGRIVRRRFFTADGSSPMAARDGGFGHAYTWDDRGRLSRRTFLDADGHPGPALGGVLHDVFVFKGAESGVTQHVHLGVGDLPTFGPEGCSSVHFRPSASDWTEARCEGPDGPSLFLATRCFTLKRSWSDTAEGRVRTTRCLDADGVPMPSLDRWERVDDRFDARGDLVERRYLTAGGEALEVSGRTATLRMVRDARGGLIGIGPNRDASGAPVGSGSEVQAWRGERDERGRFVTITSIDAQGEPWAAAERWAIWRTKRLEDSIEHRFYDADGRPVSHVRMRHRVLAELDDAGRVGSVRFYDTTSAASTALDGGIHRLDQAWSDADLLRSERVFNVHDEAALIRSPWTRPKPWRYYGWHAAIVSRDARGFEDGVRFLGLADEPIETDHGVAADRTQHDDFNRRTRVTHEGVGGALAEDVLGMAILERELPAHPRNDPRRVLTLDANKDGVASYRFCAQTTHEIRRWERGEMVERRCLDAAGGPAENANGVHLRRVWFEGTPRARRFVRRESFGLDDTPAADVLGAPIEVMTYGPEGQVASLSLLDADEAPILGVSGFAHSRRRFERGREVEHRVEGVDGELIGSEKYPYARREQEWAKGLLVEQRFFQADGSPGGQGLPDRRVFAYDEVHYEMVTSQLTGIGLRARPTAIRNLRTDGTPMEVGGIASTTYDFDDRGRVERMQTWAADGTRAGNARGVARTIQVWEEGPLPRIERSFDASGQPIAGRSGCAVLERVLDEQGQVLRTLCDGVESG